MGSFPRASNADVSRLVRKLSELVDLQNPYYYADAEEKIVAVMRFINELTVSEAFSMLFIATDKLSQINRQDEK